MKPRIAIIGAGVSGLTCGIVFAEAGYPAEIFAEKTGQATTSAVAAAIWYPYDAEPVDKLIAWSLESYDVFRELARAADSGVSMIELRNYSRAGEIEIPSWANSLGAQRLLADGSVFRSGFVITVPLIDTTIYLDYLSRRFRRAGGKEHADIHLDKLEDVSIDCDLVLNCAGIGARALVGDPELEPHRGQVAIVPKLGLNYAVVCDDAPLMYAIPRANDCVFGGTNDISEDSTTDLATTSRIVAECSRVLHIDRPMVMAARVGLRPFRKSGVRLERVRMHDGRTLIHNYGHGGSGFTLSWGCARKALNLGQSDFT
jgi:D-amino-acid oxidase